MDFHFLHVLQQAVAGGLGLSLTYDTASILPCRRPSQARAAQRRRPPFAVSDPVTRQAVSESARHHDENQPEWPLSGRRVAGSLRPRAAIMLRRRITSHRRWQRRTIRLPVESDGGPGSWAELECRLSRPKPAQSPTVMVFRAQDPARGLGRRRHAAARGRTRPGAEVVGT